MWVELCSPCLQLNGGGLDTYIEHSKEKQDIMVKRRPFDAARSLQEKWYGDQVVQQGLHYSHIVQHKPVANRKTPKRESESHTTAVAAGRVY